MGRPKKNTNTKSPSFKRKATTTPRNTATKVVEEPVVMETNEEELQQQEPAINEEVVETVNENIAVGLENAVKNTEDLIEEESEYDVAYILDDEGNEVKEPSKPIKSVTEVKLEKITKEDKKPEVDESNVTVIKLEKVGSKVEEKQEKVEVEVKDDLVFIKDNENNQEYIVDETPILEETEKEEEPKKENKKRSTWEETFHYLYY